MAFGVERRQDTQSSGRGNGALPRGHAQWAKGTDGDLLGVQVTAPGRAQGNCERSPFAGANVHALQ